MDNNKKPAGAIWFKTSKAGKDYFSLEIEGKKYVGFVNQKKSKPQQPDYIIWESQEREKDPRPKTNEYQKKIPDSLRPKNTFPQPNPHTGSSGGSAWEDDDPGF